MSLVRPRLTDHHGISVAQTEVDFAIPFLDEDIPLYLDPFLLWRSPSQQDQSLHTSLITCFNHLGSLMQKGRKAEAVDNLIVASECTEVGFGVSVNRRGKRIGAATANEILDLFSCVPKYWRSGFTHFEEIQLYVDGISKDRISDLSCNFLKSFLNRLHDRPVPQAWHPPGGRAPRKPVQLQGAAVRYKYRGRTTGDARIG